jgi:hypothetical protein
MIKILEILGGENKQRSTLDYFDMCTSYFMEILSFCVICTYNNILKIAAVSITRQPASPRPQTLALFSPNISHMRNNLFQIAFCLLFKNECRLQSISLNHSESD